MIRKRGFFQKKQSPYRIHMDETDGVTALSNQLLSQVEEHRDRELVVVCIGTDRSTGDSLGPLIGTKLDERQLSSFHVYGTLENPVHAVNLEKSLNDIENNHYRPFIIAIDACLGRLNSVGKITLAEGPVKPGAAVNKKLPPVGDIHLTGIVNIGGMMEFFVLQNTRLHFVMKMAEMISESIHLTDTKLAQIKEKPTPLFKSLKPTFFQT
ncbi:spore protease YyaC [Desertibacillus haloalkaliphilus]|uniref:spore protease YyaC n=1 Tax=Desertibacillus haloalkaliphilus TaxID=1328930 RepID=UPI001C2531C6|nr:spore protease YyaC [Desertibacillus haloalkaliphilus]MBU8905770.1 spore protease YyaC [Desertibacillus haloalkaliphilus]